MKTKKLFPISGFAFLFMILHFYPVFLGIKNAKPTEPKVL